jgi:hypothetical protein
MAHLHLHVALRRRADGQSLGPFQKEMLFFENRETLDRKEISVYIRLGRRAIINVPFQSAVIGPIFNGQEVFFLNFWNLEDGTDRLTRNFGAELPFDAV